MAVFVLTARATGAQRLVCWCPTLGPWVPIYGQDRPLDGLWQNGLCNFIPKEVFELVILHINQWSERKKYLFYNEYFLW